MFQRNEKILRKSFQKGFCLAAAGISIIICQSPKNTNHGVNQIIWSISITCIYKKNWDRFRFYLKNAKVPGTGRDFFGTKFFWGFFLLFWNPIFQIPGQIPSNWQIKVFGAIECKCQSSSTMLLASSCHHLNSFHKCLDFYPSPISSLHHLHHSFPLHSCAWCLAHSG